MKINNISILLIFMYQVLKFYELLRFPDHFFLLFIIDTIVFLSIVSLIEYDYTLEDLLKGRR